VSARDIYGAVPRWVRVVIGEILAVGIPVAGVLLSHPTDFAWAEEAALIACFALPLRLRWPWLAMLLCLPALAGLLGWPPALVALYRLGRQTAQAAVVVGWVGAAVLAVSLPVQLVREIFPLADRLWSVAFSLVSLGGAAALGALLRVRRELTASLIEVRRAREAELEARLDAARSAERARIAREIHDAVGHHSTLIAVQSAALAATTTDPETRQTAQRLRELAKESLAEMRAALGLLNGDVRAPHGLDDLPDLVARARRAGLAIEFPGVPASVEASSLVGRAVYRVVQEALTNAAKHAPASTVRVNLARERGQVIVSVVNGAAARPATVRGGGEPDATGGNGGTGGTSGTSGTGLEGLAERVRNAGGMLHVDMLPDGGFSVQASLPAHGQLPTKVGSGRSTFGGIADPVG
jgi:signal transduction histidine kinase